MIIKNFMVTNPVALRPDDSLYRAAQVMAWTDTRHLPVTMEDDHLVGLLSDRDILTYRAQKPDHDLRATPISEAMRSRPETASPEASLSEAAARLAQRHIGCLPITMQGKLVGLVTRGDILSAEVREAMIGAPNPMPNPMKVSDVMTADPICVAPGDYVFDAAKVMSDAGVRHLPVVDEARKAVGILSDRDIQALVLTAEPSVASTARAEHHLVVQDAMSKPPMRVWAQESCASVARLFILFRASAALVTDEHGTLEGIVSYIDLLRSIAPDAES